MRKVVHRNLIITVVGLLLMSVAMLIWLKKVDLNEIATVDNIAMIAVDDNIESASAKPVDKLGPIQSMEEERNRRFSSAELDSLPSAWNTKANLPTRVDHISSSADAETQFQSDLANHVIRWREILTRLDDVYSAAQIRAIRDRCLRDYCATSLKASQMIDRQERNACRDAAKSILVEGIKELEKVYETSNDEHERYEALLALGELRFKNEDYRKAVTSCKQALEGLTQKRLKAQAHYYMSRSYAKLQKKDDANYHIEVILNDYPDEAKKLYFNQSSTSLESLMRNVAFCYEKAERLHFLALRAPKRAARLIEMRDRVLAIADRFFDIEKGGSICDDLTID
jgi:tetratricopeptide (TPR) repeat protein